MVLPVHHQNQHIRISLLYNPGHNIFELYNVLVQFRFNTSNTKLDIQYNKLGISVISRVAKRVKTRILGNQEMLKKSQIWVETQPSAQSPFRNLNFANNSSKACKSKYQTFLVLSNFTGFLYFIQSIFSGIAGTKFQLKQVILILWTKLPKKKFPVKRNKTEHYHRIQYTRIILLTNFELKQTLLIL